MPECVQRSCRLAQRIGALSTVNRPPSTTRQVVMIRNMPLIRCPKCGQSYDVPGVVAVRLPQSIATCHCGEWLSGSKAAVLARLIDPKDIREIDLKPYRVDTPFEDISGDDAAPLVTRPRSVR